MKYIVLDVANIGRPKLIPNIVNHLLKGKVRTVKGGSKFERELSYCSELIEIFNELETSGLLKKYPDTEIDNAATEMEGDIISTLGQCPRECDDLHLFSLSKSVGWAPIVTLKDTRMSVCIRKLRHYVLQTYKRPLIIKSDKVYLIAFNKKRL